MKTLLPLFLLALGLFVATSSCFSPAQASAYQALSETYTAATRDGIVTEDEARAIAAAAKTYHDAPGVDWAQLGGTLLATLGCGLVGLRYLPNRMILGTEHDPDVARVAGIKPPPVT
jgi:hypothetical protein